MISIILQYRIHDISRYSLGIQLSRMCKRRFYSLTVKYISYVWISFSCFFYLFF
nr:MAG TPA: hypothetical protein [Caudoviricetes sp.]